jgi:hypothetical protein
MIMKLFRDLGGGSAKSELGIYEGKKKLNVRETMT